MNTIQGHFGIILHGGAWSPPPDERDGREAPFLREALDVGWRSLTSGLPGERVVVEVLRILEGSELFDAGYGSYPNENGEVYTDVALMRGDGDFISLLGASQVRYPSELAFDMFPPGTRLMTVWTPRRAEALRLGSPDAHHRYGYVTDPKELIAERAAARSARARRERRATIGHDTVGCVVRDLQGKIFAGTSTGGTPCKPDGRIGDAPIVGAGVYADDDVCGLSATGEGERILQAMLSGYVTGAVRAALRRDAHCFVTDENLLATIINDELHHLRARFPSAEAGMIVMPSRGLPAWGFNSGMLSVAMRAGTRDAITAEFVGPSYTAP